MRERQPSAVIIGAGLGGLATAARLAHRGWRVTVCEQAPTPGGKMNRWQTHGFTFDTGPSLITMPWAFRELFADLDERLDDHLELMPVYPLAEYVFADGVRFAHSAQLPDWLNTVRQLENGDAAGFLRFMTLGARLYALSAATFFKHAPGEPPEPEVFRALRHIPLADGFGNYHRVVCRYFKSPHLRQMFDRYTTYVGSSPHATPSTLSVIPYVEYAFGGVHIRGGLYRLVEVLAGLAQRRGVELRSGSRVTGIRNAGGRVTGVDLADGRPVEADIVIMNGDASMAGGLLQDPKARPLAEDQRSLSGFMLLLALRRTMPEAVHHRVFFSADYDREFSQLFAERRFPDDPTVYVNMPSRTDRSLAPGEGEVMFVMANAPARDGALWDAAMTQQARAAVLRRLQRSGFPDVTADIVAETIWTPRRLAETYAMPGGAIYGRNSHGWRNAFLRPPNQDRRFKNLYYVGGSTHPGGGTPTVLMSSRITCNLIQRAHPQPE